MKLPLRSLEIFVIIIVVIGFNIGRLVPHLDATGIIIACISLLAWAIIIFRSEEQFDFTSFSFTLILIRVVTPIVAFVMTITFYVFFYKQPQTPVSEITVRKVKIVDCASIRYGTFRHLSDTIVRMRSGDHDIEIRNRLDTFNIAWIDSCYYRVSKPSRLLEFYRIIDIRNNRISLEKIKNDFKRELVTHIRID